MAKPLPPRPTCRHSDGYGYCSACWREALARPFTATEAAYLDASAAVLTSPTPAWPTLRVPRLPSFAKARAVDAILASFNNRARYVGRALAPGWVVRVDTHGEVVCVPGDTQHLAPLPLADDVPAGTDAETFTLTPDFWGAYARVRLALVPRGECGVTWSLGAGGITLSAAGRLPGSHTSQRDGPDVTCRELVPSPAPLTPRTLTLSDSTVWALRGGVWQVTFRGPVTQFQRPDVLVVTRNYSD